MSPTLFCQEIYIVLWILKPLYYIIHVASMVVRSMYSLIGQVTGAPRIPPTFRCSDYFQNAQYNVSGWKVGSLYNTTRWASQNETSLSYFTTASHNMYDGMQVATRRVPWLTPQ